MISPLAYVDKEARIGTDNIVYQGRDTNTSDCTTIGDSNFLLKGVHLAPNPHLSSHCVLGNGVQTARNYILSTTRRFRAVKRSFNTVAVSLYPPPFFRHLVQVKKTGRRSNLPVINRYNLRRL